MEPGKKIEQPLTYEKIKKPSSRKKPLFWILPDQNRSTTAIVVRMEKDMVHPIRDQE